MSKLRIVDAPLLPDVDGTEKIPTGGRGDYAISVDQIKDHIFQDVGKELVGLGNVDNTSDLDKPVSTAQQEALNLKADKTYVDTNLDLKADKTSVYTRSETTLALSQKADLVNGVIPENQIPSSFNDVLEFTTPNLPIIGESGKIYVTTDTNKTWRWTTNKYVEISGWNPDSVSKRVTLPTYYTKEAGVDPVTGVADGAYFNLRSSNDESYIDEYQNVGGSAVATGKSYLSALGVQSQEKPANTIKDASGRWQQEINDNVLFRVKSIIELRAFIPLFDGQKVVLDGFYEASQDGAGDFVWDAASTETVVPGIVEKVNLLTIGRFKRVIVNNTISLLDTGSIRDGVTETHDQVIAALRFCNSNKVDCYAPNGIYLMGLQAQIDLINGGNFGLYGDSEGQTIFKERDGLTAEKGKFNKTLYFLANTGIIVDRLAIKNILIDKNGRTSPLTPEQLSTDIWAYEQAHCIGISTSWTNSKIKFLDIENVTTKDKIGAGICLMAGRADVVSVKNIKGIDFQFDVGERADFEFQMHVKNLVLADSSGTYIQSEYDNLVATDTLRMTMKRCKYDMVDIMCTSDATKQLVFLEDVQAGRLLHVRNCTVFGKNVTGKVGTISQEYWYNLGVGSEFDETCDFIIDARTDVTPRVTKPFYLRTGELTFKGRFVAGDGFEETVNGFAVTNQGFYDGSNIQHKLVLDGARFDNKFERSVNAYANGNFVIKRCKLAGRAGALNAIAVGGFNTYYSNVELEDNDLSQLGAGLLQYTATNNLFSVVFKGEHDYAKSGFTSSNQTNSNSQTKCIGSFYSTSSPGIGYQGAVVRILNPDLGRPSVYQNLIGNSAAASAVWCVSSQAGLASGNTASRPTATSKENGLRYHNTETAKIETWNGTAWV